MGWLARRLNRREEQRVAAAELAAIIAMAEEDTTLLGEQLSRLGVESQGVALGAQTREDYQGSLDAYEAAKRAVPRLTSAEDVSSVIDVLTTGRYLLTCVRAGLAGQPRPERRTPCFFNPQHGPSARDVRYTIPGGHGTRTVPACAQDAARVESGQKPEIRKVRVGGVETPHWQAGEPILPYGRGWYAEGMITTQRNQIENLGGFGL